MKYEERVEPTEPKVIFSEELEYPTEIPKMESMGGSTHDLEELYVKY